jgi:hypothetical protein
MGTVKNYWNGKTDIPEGFFDDCVDYDPDLAAEQERQEELRRREEHRRAEERSAERYRLFHAYAPVVLVVLAIVAWVLTQ